ncbi:MAG TPA: ABC transporter substrate-binding protein [Chromatiaceae bacterium]|jgi:phospholipid transport system substrate-binding protein|nr:ABC transporter substrate-binding protein [Chromatiaceae bacterium]HIB83354.1 ABC transporter substrate-binding protein [Chromatiaceae bacterium]HIN83011.1 ABC transporter substrate-binding protein [Chromatiales bacterium]HIO15034.1 ABC transporter substrate-binding protein [Chromatiales bacterium]HIO54365.1 ABC transporter substrate-binding protein [Chromatiales bacterium]
MIERVLQQTSWLALLLASLIASPALADINGDLHPAQTLIKQTTSEVLTVLHDHRELMESDRQAVYKLISDKIVPHFDFKRISSLVLGRYGRRASVAERQNFQQQFERLLIRGYATALLDFIDAPINVLPVRSSAEDREVLVRVEVKPLGAPSVQVHYRIYEDHGVWKIFDVRVDGISLVTNYRTSFGGVIRRHGIAGLIDQLAERNARVTTR